MTVIATRAGFSVRRYRLALTDCGSSLDSSCGVERDMEDDEPRHYMYRVTVDGTGIQETWETDEEVPCGIVVQRWLEAVEDRWGTDVVEAIKDATEAEKIWKNKDSTSEAQMTALPPAEEDRVQDDNSDSTR